MLSCDEKSQIQALNAGSFEVWLAIPNRVAAPRIEQPAIRVVHMSDDALTEGFQCKRIDGVAVPIFNPARTVVDCFKFRNKIGIDVALEALRDDGRKHTFAMDELWHHAGQSLLGSVHRPSTQSGPRFDVNLSREAVGASPHGMVPDHSTPQQLITPARGG